MRVLGYFKGETFGNFWESPPEWSLETKMADPEVLSVDPS